MRNGLPADADVQALKEHNVLLVKLRRGTTRSKVNQTLSRLRSEGKVEFVTSVLKDTDTGLLRIPTDEIIVRCKPTVSEDRCKQLVAGLGLEVVRRNEFVPNQYVVRFAAPNFVSQYHRSASKPDAKK